MAIQVLFSVVLFISGICIGLSIEIPSYEQRIISLLQKLDEMNEKNDSLISEEIKRRLGMQRPNMHLNNEIADDIEIVLEYLKMQNINHPADVVNSMGRIESEIATFQPNHLTDKDLDH